jgi:hypothetical protein
MLDEALAILDGLWSGEEFGFTGKHYRLKPMRLLPRPVQRPRIPIVVAGYWPYHRPMRRAARWDGMYPLFPDRGPGLSEQLAAVVAFLHEHRPAEAADAPFEIFDGGETPGDDPAASARLGATWWLEAINPWRYGWEWGEVGTAWPKIGHALDRIRQGPPTGP